MLAPLWGVAVAVAVADVAFWVLPRKGRKDGSRTSKKFTTKTFYYHNSRVLTLFCYFEVLVPLPWVADRLSHRPAPPPPGRVGGNNLA